MARSAGADPHTSVEAFIDRLQLGAAYRIHLLHRTERADTP